MALFHREKSGRGQVVDAAIYESVLAFMESLLPEYALGGHTRQRSGGILPRIAPSGAYPCSDGMVIIGANQDTLFQRLSQMMGTEWATDPRYATHDARGENQLELDDMIADWTRQRSMRDVLRQCEAHAIPSGPVNTAKDMLVDDHMKAREAIQNIFSPLLGKEVPMQGVVPKLDATPGAITTAGPALGQDTGAILEVLGYSPEDQAALREQNVI